ncbi:MAG: MerR family transcriptional regulator [Flavisolibacter sp.]
MQHFTIRDIENLTGIKAHTLRIWEQRYQLFTPRRKESLHRIYDNEDLKQLLHVSFLYNSGWKISKIAGLSSAEMSELVRTAPVEAGSYTQFIHQMIEAALDLNEREFSTVFNRILEKTGFEKGVLHVCYPYLMKIGHLWTTNNIIPAQEHFTSYIIQNRIIAETDKLSASATRRPRILLMCPGGEFHELPLLFIHYLLKKNGWDCLYLGSNVRVEDLEPLVLHQEIPFLYLHLLTNFTGLEVDDYFESICAKFPDKKILVSGLGAQRIQKSFANLKCLNNDGDIYKFIEQGLMP